MATPITPYSGTAPNPFTQTQPEFDANTQAWVDFTTRLPDEINQFAEDLGTANTNSTSVTSLSVGTGSKSLVVDTGKAYFAGQSLTIARTSAPTNRMFAVVDSYNSGTGALVVTSQAFEGSGTFTDWTITLGFNGLIQSGQIDVSVINNQTEDTAPTPSDFVLEYDTSASALKKVTLANLLFADTKLYRLNSDVVGANATGAQSMFGVGIALEANRVYEFEIVVAFLKTSGSNNHTFRLGFGGTATLNNIMYEYVAQTSPNPSDVNSQPEMGVLETAAETIVTGTISNATQYVYGVIKGTVSIGDAGTFIPQYYLGAAPGGAYSTKAGSFVKIRRLGASGANTNIGGWA